MEVGAEYDLDAEIPELPYGLYPMCVPWGIMYENTDSHNKSLTDSLDTAIRLAEENGYRLLFVTIPTKEVVYTEELLPYCGPEAESIINKQRAGYEFICNYLESNGQLCYDTTEDFQAAADELGLLYNRLDNHWNPEGHEVFADLLIEYMDEHQLLDDLSIQPPEQ